MRQEQTLVIEPSALAGIGFATKSISTLLDSPAIKALQETAQHFEEISKALGGSVGLGKFLEMQKAQLMQIRKYLDNPKVRLEYWIYKKSKIKNPFIELVYVALNSFLNCILKTFKRVNSRLNRLSWFKRVSTYNQRKRMMLSRGLALTGAPNIRPINGDLSTRRLLLGIA